ncbi:MAG: hypothetical protein J6B67_02985 [Oscillospiraceae bacterium]|nr:hypothetical protein [Oscillospiraceae bacterium]
MNKKVLLAVIALVVAAAVMVGVYFATRPETAEGGKTITVTVVHKDGSSKDFTYSTDEAYLGPVIQSEGLVEGYMGDFGLYITAVDGETADYSVDQGWWALYIGEESAVTGADAVAIEDGGVYKLVYTIG